MGIHSRDYVRESPRWDGPTGGPTGSVIAKVIGLTGVIFLLQMATKSPGSAVSAVDRWLALIPSTVVPGAQIWRLLTYAFCHDTGNLLHILFNMLMLWWFGRRLESIYGSREFTWFYGAAAVFSGVVQLGWSLVSGSNAFVVGASGAINAALMLTAMHFPRERVRLWGVLELELRWLVVLAVGLPLIMDLASPRSAGIAHAAHIGGVLFGYIYRTSNMRFDSLFSRMGAADRAFRSRERARSKNLRVYDPVAEAEVSEDQVDRLLQKISEQGEASLTDAERETLSRASRAYRNR